MRVRSEIVYSPDGYLPPPSGAQLPVAKLTQQYAAPQDVRKPSNLRPHPVTRREDQAHMRDRQGAGEGEAFRGDEGVGGVQVLRQGSDHDDR